MWKMDIIIDNYVIPISSINAGLVYLSTSLCSRLCTISSTYYTTMFLSTPNSSGTVLANLYSNNNNTVLQYIIMMRSLSFYYYYCCCCVIIMTATTTTTRTRRQPLSTHASAHHHNRTTTHTKRQQNSCEYKVRNIFLTPRTQNLQNMSSLLNLFASTEAKTEAPTPSKDLGDQKHANLPGGVDALSLNGQSGVKHKLHGARVKCIMQYEGRSRRSK